MARRRHTPDQILAKLRDVDVMLANGKQIPEIAKALEVSEATLHRWRNQFGGIDLPPPWWTSHEPSLMRSSDGEAKAQAVHGRAKG